MTNCKHAALSLLEILHFEYLSLCISGGFSQSQSHMHMITISLHSLKSGCTIASTVLKFFPLDILYKRLQFKMWWCHVGCKVCFKSTQLTVLDKLEAVSVSVLAHCNFTICAIYIPPNSKNVIIYKTLICT